MADSEFKSRWGRHFFRPYERGSPLRFLLLQIPCKYARSHFLFALQRLFERRAVEGVDLVDHVETRDASLRSWTARVMVTVQMYQKAASNHCRGIRQPESS